MVSTLHSLQETLKSLQRTLYALRDSRREWLLADLLNRPGPLWLAGLDLAHANLSHANLEGADLSGANLEGAHLEGAKNLEKATLTNVIFLAATVAKSA